MILTGPVVIDNQISWDGRCSRCGRRVNQDTSTLHWADRDWQAICKNQQICTQPPD